MRRISLVAPLILTIALAGCGRPADEDDAGAPEGNGGGGSSATKVSAELKPLPAKEGTVLKGKVVLKGAKPDVASLAAAVQDQMQKKDPSACFDPTASDSEKTQQNWRIDDNGGVANVVVWIEPPDGSFFKVDLKDPKTKTWEDKIELKQPHCAFIPHVSWAMPSVMDVDPADPTKTVTIPSGQKFYVSNTASVGHNTKWSSLVGSANSGEQGTLASGTPPKELSSPLKGNNQLVHFACAIHPWMDAYVWVFNHPYADVTRADGSYEIKNVPAGSKVRIVAWHENGPYAPGYLTSARLKGEEIQLTDKETVHDFDFEVKPAK